MGVAPSASVLQFCLSAKGFREGLITEEFAAGCWPLSEIQDTVAHDITGLGHDGTYVGSGFTRGIPTDLPEGGLGLTLNGGYIEVPDDVIATGRNLSLAGGSIDIVFLIKNTQNDATNRCIVQKMVTDATGDGWSVSLVSGKIRFRIEAGGVQVFSLDSATSVTSGAWTLVHCFYDPASVTRARIYLNGVQDAQTSSGLTTELDYEACNLRIGAWNDGTGTFAGNTTLSFVMVGREGDVNLSSELQAARQWTTITDARQSAPMVWDSGIRDSAPTALMATSGSFSFVLDNSARNSVSTQGAYSPGHASCRTGFRIGAAVRWSVTYSGVTTYLFVGRIVAIAPEAGSNQSREVRVSCLDWIDVAAGTVLNALPTLLDQRSDQVFGRVLDECNGRTPHALSIGLGTETFVYAGEIGEEGPLLTELARVVISERGYMFISADTVQGGTLVYQGRSARQLLFDVSATISNTMDGVDVEATMARMINRIRLTVYPRTVDAAATTVLWEMTRRQLIAAGESVTIEGRYNDPTNPDVKVGGIEQVTPVSGTDFSLTTDIDGGGTDLTADLDVQTTISGRSATFVVTNNAVESGYFQLQIRGKAIRHYNPQTVNVQDDNSIRTYGPRTLPIDLPYVTDAGTARSLGEALLSGWGGMVPLPTKVRIKANTSDALMTQVLNRRIGDKIGLVETVTGLVTDTPTTDQVVGYHINGIRLTYGPGVMLQCEWTLTPPPAALVGAWVLDEVGASELDETTYLGV